MEIWKEVKGYEGLYEISNLGNVKSLSRSIVRGNGVMGKAFVNSKLVKKSITRLNYEKVNLSKNNVAKTFAVHRLVAIAFIDNTENKPQVNHKDGNKLNNCVDNLEWCTASENQLHALKLGLIIPKRGKDHYLHNNPKANPQYGKKGILSPNYGKRGVFSPIYGRTGALSSASKLVLHKETGIFYDSAKEAAIALGYKHSTLKGYLNGSLKNKTSLIYA
jgi:hypothetical protein